MQRFELLGGKYQQGEQILPGVIQTFRSYEVATGRPVFIHRIPSNDPAAQEIAGLLSAGLIRSVAVRKMLLDVYESEPYRFIVTEPARQCVPLRDWLEGEGGKTPEPEVELAPAVELPARVEQERSQKLRPSAEPEPLPEPASKAEVEAIEPPPDAEGSEFARLFHEALSGKLERSRRNALQQNPPAPSPDPGADRLPLEQEAEQPKPPVRPAAQPLMTLVPREAAPRARISEAEETKKISPPVAGAAVAAPVPPGEPELFSQVAQTQDAGRSTLIVFLVVLGVLVVLLVMFVLVFVKR